VQVREAGTQQYKVRMRGYPRRIDSSRGLNRDGKEQGEIVAFWLDFLWSSKSLICRMEAVTEGRGLPNNDI